MRKQLKSEETMQSPKVFASYSHDSDEHREWVLQLCTKLRENGVDVTLDEWDWNVGGLMHPFMREGITDSDRVLVVCTDRYVEKANALEGGVGYEISIIDTELDQDLKTDKFIPIIRQSTGEPKIPASLGVRRYIDFRNDGDFEQKFDELLRTIQGNPINPKPSLGEYSFPKQSFSSESTSRNFINIPEKVESVSNTYKLAFDLARAGDTVGWRQLVKRIMEDTSKSLEKWRLELEQQRPENKDELFKVVDKTVDIVSPLICVSFAGVESGKENFNDQKSVLHDLFTIVEWKDSNYSVWIDMPDVLRYVFHSLHGSLCLQTDQLDLAFSLAQAKFPLAMDSQFTRSLWENRQLMGYCESLGNQRIESWKYLVNAYERWEWLSHIFADDVEYRTSLVAYYMALSMHELAVEIDTGREIGSNSFNSVNVPFDFLYEKYEIKQRATLLLRRDPTLPELWTCVGVTQDQMRDSWEAWIKWYETLFWRTNQGSSNFQALVTNPSQYLNFFDAL